LGVALLEIGPSSGGAVLSCEAACNSGASGWVRAAGGRAGADDCATPRSGDRAVAGARAGLGAAQLVVPMSAVNEESAVFVHHVLARDPEACAMGRQL